MVFLKSRSTKKGVPIETSAESRWERDGQAFAESARLQDSGQLCSVNTARLSRPILLTLNEMGVGGTPRLALAQSAATRFRSQGPNLNFVG